MLDELTIALSSSPKLIRHTDVVSNNFIDCAWDPLSKPSAFPG
jgi:hypothetical protein